MDKNQTAVEWLEQTVKLPLSEWPDDIWGQAKAMEKQQIIDAFDYGFASGYDDAKGDGPTYEDGEDYYRNQFRTSQTNGNVATEGGEG